MSTLLAGTVYLRMSLRTEAQYSVDLPEGFVFVEFSPDRHAKPARELLNRSFAGGGGEVLDFGDWWEALNDDEEYDPSLCFVIETSEAAEMVGFAQCWTSGFVKDIAIHPDYRRRGLACALMNRIFSVFRLRGIKSVDLRAQENNPNGALAFYDAIGMKASA